MDEKVLLVRSKLQDKLNSFSTKWYKVFERNGTLEALITVADVVDKIDHNYTVLDKLTNKKTRKELFVVNPSGPTNVDSSRLRQKYGKKVLDGKARSLRVPLYVNKDTLYDKKYKFRLVINYEEERIYIKICGTRGKFYEQKVYWTFDSIREMVEKKIKKFAVVEHESKYVGLDEYFRIKKVMLYEKVNFDKFIEEFERGNIRIYLKVSVYMSGIYIGKTHDHGATFEIFDNTMQNIYDTCLITRQ